MTNEQIYQLVYQIAFILVALLAGGASVNVIKWLKGLLKTSGNGTLALVAAVALLVTVATMIVEYALVPGAVTLENFGTVMVAVIVASQMRYRMLLDELEAEPDQVEAE
jgi:hypothetical protein